MADIKDLLKEVIQSEVNMANLENEKNLYEKHLFKGGKPFEIRVRMMPGEGKHIDLQIRTDHKPSTLLLRMFAELLEENVRKALQPPEKGGNQCH